MPSIGTSIPHDSAPGHVTGQAPYVEDLTPLAGELWVDFVGTPTAAGRITSIDIDEALKLPGVVGVYTYRDLPADGAKTFGPIFHDEVFLPEDADWLGPFLNELLGFPNAKYDDQVDTFSQLLNYVRDRERNDSAVPVGGIVWIRGD